MRLIGPSDASVRVITFNGKKLLPELTLVIFSRSALPYAKGTSTRLIRLISIGGGVLFLGGAFYLFCFNRLAFLCCSEAGCGPIVCACLKEKEAGSLYRDCNSYYIVLICCFLLIL
ncbi:hypothetical protein RY63_15790 [Salmonella enterica subsp. enterica serovar Typhimurium]|uniref:Viral protein n=10 Tax=Salmonella enterica TaxID=28901 RepID=Q8ZRX7_SALTY|nr:putative viral protein [Salmonella enterica]NP_446529.1 putative viral protein [Salmonella enterica subsp. enterica serovar Typhimurium str. LT2]EAA1022139.1 hypothetical protein [Salmonella enterica subsp. enterica serovar Saintpaul]EAA1101835.1 hypothetical protein [Salmonella enterica subsp. enterica]EAA1718762.1 hypothetical protein [Salmonella enterica subsp. enterica serovar Typhimurium]EAA8867101.1 hypothetical protein [Salmonella enterica subsp. enterica serovar Choleraesuis]EBH010